MATIQLPKVNQPPAEDPYLAIAAERIHAAVRDLIARGIIDAEGNLLIDEIPPDMREGSGLDFGG